MKTNSTDTIINVDIAVDVHGYRKRATKADKDLAKSLSEQSKDLFFQMLTLYVNTGDQKYELYEYKKNKYAFREISGEKK